METLANGAGWDQLVVFREDVQAIETTATENDNVFGVGVGKDFVSPRHWNSGSGKNTTVLSHAERDILFTLVKGDLILLEQFPIDHNGLDELTGPSKLCVSSTTTHEQQRESHKPTWSDV